MKVTTDRRELVEWLLDHHWELVKDELIERGASPFTFVYTALGNDTVWLLQHFNDDRIVNMQEHEQQALREKRIGL